MSTPTDSNLSIAAPEFIWADSKVPEAHSYLVPPTLKALRESNARTVLDLGCGNGACSARLQSEGFMVTACDSSTSGIVFARRTHPTIDFFQHDISQPLPPRCLGKFDAVVSLEVVEHLLQPRYLIASARQALLPGGVAIISTPFHGYWKNLALAVTDSFDDHWHPLRDFGHVKFFSKKTLFSLLEEMDLSVKDFIRVGRVPLLARSMLVVALKSQ